MHPRQPALHHLVETIDVHLSSCTREVAGIAEIRAALAAFRCRIVPRDLPERQSRPAIGDLDAILELVARQSGAELAAAIRAALPWLNWVTYGAYPLAEIGPRFPTHHAFASLSALYDPEYALDFDLGLFLIAPFTLYRDHRHKAPELYLPLTGPSLWRFGLEDSWQKREAGEPVWNPPFALHATRVEAVPFLCLYGWSRDVHFPAGVAPAGDWREIEAQLAQQGSTSGDLP
ncbi:dimethlysulfoniopropionate lyase [Dongia mobilis]|uniref:Dimethlysulfoniopropionate lyase n=1 Tax=Dongia mobilis TaxID=578943 RepID=A0A4R6WU07_9PROT|nr:dimethylsulfonioproprionate lyase family protein [Dongia mobilis]TDQ83859.1 dimethlysulfoniopropionate lyase [Dongia mobilis]